MRRRLPPERSQTPDDDYLAGAAPGSCGPIGEGEARAAELSTLMANLRTPARFTRSMM